MPSRPRHVVPAAAATVALVLSVGGCQSPALPAADPAPALAEPPPVLPIDVSAETAGQVVVVDLARGRVAARIAVGKRPRGIRLSPDGRPPLAALSSSPIAGPGVDESTLPPADRTADGIGIVDLAAARLVRVLPSGQEPEAFDIAPDGRTVCVSNEETGEMSLVDVATRTIRRVPVSGEPEGVTLRPDGRVVYVTAEARTRGGRRDRRGVGPCAAVHSRRRARPWGIGVSLGGRWVVTANGPSGDVSVVDLTTGVVVRRIVVGGSPSGLVVGRPPEVAGAP